MNGYQLKPLTVQTFGELWKNCFPHVKIREFKAVCGKCDTCAHLSSLRRKMVSLEGK
jgi:hypothetical protein